MPPLSRLDEGLLPSGDALRLEKGIRAAGVGTWVWEVPDNEVFADAYVTAMFAIPRQYGEGGPLEYFLDAIHPEDQVRVRQVIDATLNSGEDYEAEYRLCPQPGEWRWFHSRGKLETDESGKPLRLIGGFIDITDRKHQQDRFEQLSRQMSEQELLYDTALSHIADFAYVFDLEGRFQYVNKPLLDLWGLTLAEAKGKNFFDLKYPEDLAAKLQSQIDLVIKTRQSLSDETPYTSPTGEAGYYEYIFTPVVDAYGEVSSVAGSTRLITKRKAAEQALRESEERFRDLADNIKQFAWMADTTGRVFWINRRWAEFTGIPLAESESVTDEQRRAIHHPEHLDRVMAKYRQAIQDGREWEDTFPLRGKDGEYRWFLSRAVPIRDHSGKVLRYFGTNTDITEERDTQEALRESEQRHREILERLPAPCYTTDAEGRLTFFNAAAVQLWGRTPDLGQERWCGSLSMSSLKGEIMPLDQCPAAIALREKRPLRGMEVFVHRPDGTRRQVIPYPNPLLDAEGRCVGVINVVNDVTEQRDAERTLRESEAFLQSIMGATADCVKVLNLEGRLEWMSDNGKDLMEVADFAQLQGRYWPELWQDPVRKEAVKSIQNALEGGVGRFQGFCQTCAGTDKWWDVAVTSIRDALGHPQRLLCVSRDITQQRATQEALREKEMLLHATFHQASTLISVLDIEGLMVDVNDAALVAAGLKREEQLHRPFWETGWWGRSAEVQHTIRTAVQAAAAGSSCRLESVYFTSSSAERWVDLCITPMRQEGRVVAILAEGRDITELKDAHRAIESARDDAQRASVAKDDFLAALSHELRTPLGPVLLLAGEGAQDQKLPASVRADFDMISKNVSLEARLIDDLLDLTRITRDKMRLDLSPVAVYAVLNDAINTVQPEIKQKRLVLDVQLQDGSPAVMADAVRLQQVFWNILKNAVKFTPVGGHIRVEGSANPDYGQFTIRITDSGIGMSAEELKRVFEAFSQGDHACGGSHVFGGLGLGLAISRKLVELHSGHITATSAGVGKGAVFTLELPLLDSAVLGAAAQASAPNRLNWIDMPASPNQGRILLVEDHEASRVTLTKLLQRRHYNVVAAASMAEALASGLDDPFDVLLTDIGLPDGDGYELMAALRGYHPGLVGIAMTGYGTEADILRSSRAGFVTHLVKPVRLEALQSALASAFAALSHR